MHSFEWTGRVAVSAWLLQPDRATHAAWQLLRMRYGGLPEHEGGKTYTWHDRHAGTEQKKIRSKFIKTTWLCWKCGEAIVRLEQERKKTGGRLAVDSLESTHVLSTDRLMSLSSPMGMKGAVLLLDRWPGERTGGSPHVSSPGSRGVTQDRIKINLFCYSMCSVGCCSCWPF